MSELLQKINYQYIIDHLFDADDFWYAAFPGIYQELSEAIIEAKEQIGDLEIKLIIDPKEEAFRNHHGDVGAVNDLVYEGVSILEIPGHRLGFIMSEKDAWLLFTQSRAIEKEARGYNAIRMSAVTKNELMLHFFGHSSDKDIRENITGEMQGLIDLKNQIEMYGKTDLTPADMDMDEFDYVSHSLHHNPPQSPDLKRLYDVYSTKIKFVEFEVSGIKFYQKSITIPNRILNLVDDSLRDQITTRLRLFDDKLQQNVKEKLSLINKEIDTIRDSFLKRVKSRDKSVIEASKLRAFNNSLDKLRDKYEQFRIDIEVDIRSSIISIKDRLKNELIPKLRESPPDDLKRFKENDQFELFLNDYVSKEIDSISLPTIESLMNSFDITKRIFDPTHNDFRDEDFISELVENGFLKKADKDEIVDKFKAIGIQPNEA